MILDEIVNPDDLWQMSLGEKAAILYLLGRMEQKSIAVEVGSYRGGFLRVLSQQFEHVYSLDVDHSQVWGREYFTNVTWVEGDSRETLPALLADLGGQAVNLVLIDGDHSYEAALADINNVLSHVPSASLAVLMHDSWYGPTREAINHAGWETCPYVHWVEKDFVPGDLIGSAHGNLFVGGLALALLAPEQRSGPIEIRQSQDYMYRICLEGLERRARADDDASRTDRGAGAQQGLDSSEVPAGP